MEELLKQLLAAELAKVSGSTDEPVAQKAATPPAEPQAAAIDMAAVAALIKSSVEEQVQKALPAPVREPGAGRVGVERKSGDATPEQAIAELVAKAAKPSELSIAEKNYIWELTRRGLAHGLKNAGE